MKPKVYLAAGWFNPEQKKQMEQVLSVLQKMHANGIVDYFAPYQDGFVLKKEDPERKRKMAMVWWLDINQLKECDLIIAVTQDHDVGTIFECGYASALQKIVFCYNSNPALGLNVMLAQEARGFYKDEKKLEEGILEFVNAWLCDSKETVYREFRTNVWEGEPI